MAPSSFTKAAKLLMTLDPGTAGKLLKSASPQTVKQIAAELAYLRNTGSPGQVDFSEAVREFLGLLNEAGKRSEGDFVEEILQNSLGREECVSAIKQVQDLVQARDPFVDIRPANVKAIAKALEGESAQVAAMILAELTPKKSAQLLALLPEDMKAQVVLGMAGAAQASVEARLRVATVIAERMTQAVSQGDTTVPDETVPSDDARQQQLRKIALVLRSLDPEFRSSMVESIGKQNEQDGQEVQSLMVTWEDLKSVSERPLQEALRTADAGQLALALVEADEVTAAKIRQNISERAAAMLDEEASLLSSPKAEDIEQAREKILKTLREMNSKGELTFEEE